MNKYVIKNCPVCELSDWEECTGYLAEGYICNDIHTEIVECKDRTDCKMKQIVELCKEDLKPVREWQEGDTVFIEYKKDVHLANNILQLLQIEEVE